MLRCIEIIFPHHVSQKIGQVQVLGDEEVNSFAFVHIPWKRITPIWRHGLHRSTRSLDQNKEKSAAANIR